MTAVQVATLVAVALGGTAVVLARDPARQALVASVYGLALVLVAAGGTAVVATKDPRRQVFVSSFFGLCLAVLFFCFQAPDVALSQIVVGAVGLPAMIIYALRKIIRREQVDQEER